MKAMPYEEYSMYADKLKDLREELLLCKDNVNAWKGWTSEEAKGWKAKWEQQVEWCQQEIKLLTAKMKAMKAMKAKTVMKAPKVVKARHVQGRLEGVLTAQPAA